MDVEEEVEEKHAAEETVQEHNNPNQDESLTTQPTNKYEKDPDKPVCEGRPFKSSITEVNIECGPRKKVKESCQKPTVDSFKSRGSSCNHSLPEVIVEHGGPVKMGATTNTCCKNVCENYQKSAAENDSKNTCKKDADSACTNSSGRPSCNSCRSDNLKECRGSEKTLTRNSCGPPEIIVTKVPYSKRVCGDTNRVNSQKITDEIPSKNTCAKEPVKPQCGRPSCKSCKPEQMKECGGPESMSTKNACPKNEYEERHKNNCEKATDEIDRKDVCGGPASKSVGKNSNPTNCRKAPDQTQPPCIKRLEKNKECGEPEKVLSKNTCCKKPCPTNSQAKNCNVKDEVLSESLQESKFSPNACSTQIQIEVETNKCTKKNTYRPLAEILEVTDENGCVLGYTLQSFSSTFTDLLKKETDDRKEELRKSKSSLQEVEIDAEDSSCDPNSIQNHESFVALQSEVQCTMIALQNMQADIEKLKVKIDKRC